MGWVCQLLSPILSEGAFVHYSTLPHRPNGSREIRQSFAIQYRESSLNEYFIS